MISWNGINSDTLGVIVQTIPARTIAKKKINVYSVPGRNGDIIDDEEAFENYSQKYTIFIEGDDVINLPLRCRKINDWLMSPKGYNKLIDNYDINTFRRAYFQGPVDVSTWFNIHGFAEIEFICDPRRYLDSGEKPITISTSGSTILNPTNFKAKPLLKITGSQSAPGTVTIAGTQITINSLVNNMYIDCETGNCYKGSTQYNDKIYATDMPVLTSGNNTISFTGITSVTITPRWWTL